MEFLFKELLPIHSYPVIIYCKLDWFIYMVA